MFEKKFIEACLCGEAILEDLDDYVDYWHEHPSDMTLREFLGMTPYEYGQWVQRDDTVLRDILRCRRDGVPFEQYPSMDHQARIAARSYDEQKVEKLKLAERRGKQDNE